MDLWQSALETTLWGNNMVQYWLMFGVFLLITILIELNYNRLIAWWSTKAKKSKSKLDDRLVKIFAAIPNCFWYFLIFLWCFRGFLNLPAKIAHITEGLILVLLVYQLIKIVHAVLLYALKYQLKADKTTLQGVDLIIKIILWSVALMLVLSNLGFDITALATSMGIGGIAIALALQNILGDLFASFTIYFDKPFEVGDWIEIGDHDGEVEKIGLKTTRIRTLYGDELVVSNRELTEAKIRNFKKIEQRRKKFTLSVPFSTPVSKLKKIPHLIQSICDENKWIELDRCYLYEFGVSAYEFQISLKILSADFKIFLTERQNFNFELIEAFEKNGIQFAYPMQKVVVEKQLGK
jgi:small-conductance mechanosensitive channel